MLILAQAAVLLPAVRMACRFVTFARLQRLSDRLAGPSRAKSLGPEVAARLVRIAADRGLYRARCLERSLVLRWILRREGVDARIILGARKDDNEMQAHAWVEVDGVSLDDETDFHRPFSPFERIATSDANEANHIATRMI
jgi:hypothetical protein